MRIFSFEKKDFKPFKIILFLLINLLTLFLKLKKERYIFLREDRIGHQASNTDVELSKAIKLKKENISSIFVFFEMEENIANRYLRSQLIKEINKKFKIIILYKTFFYYRFIYFLIAKTQQYGLFNNTIYFANTDVGERIKKQILYKSNSFKKLLENLGIKSNNYVCIYSRDQNYLKNKFPSNDWEYHKYRNSNIDNLKLLSEYLVANYGLSIVRVGSNPAKRLTWDKDTNPKIIDYSFSEHLSEKNDIDLISGCKLYINNGGGPEGVAVASRRNIIRINQTPILFELGYQHGIYLPKLIRNKKNNKIIGIRETINLGIFNSFNYYDYENLGLFAEENKSIDILNAFKDFIKYKNQNFNDTEISIINEYKKLRKENEQKGYILSGYENFIAPSFLLKYPDILK
tara:strand:+ start:295 stop:1503 length:1209 start_codon:yes stop_codon:yes gene_type:complete